MAGTTTAFCSSAKQELPFGYHCFAATQSSLSGTTSNTVFTITGLASTSNLAVGMAVAGTNIAAGSVIASIDSSTQVTMSKAATGAAGSSISFTGDAFKIALVKVSPSGTFGAATTNYTSLSTDEVANGSGYTTGGFALTNINPGLTGTQAFWQFSSNPSWTSSSFSTTGAIIYNTQTGRSGTTTRTIAVEDFGGTQTVSGSGTLTLVQPTNSAGTSLLQLN